MFEVFRKAFPRDALPHPDPAAAPAASATPALTEFFGEFGGGSFGGGLYRVVRPSDANIWDERVQLAFPEFAGHVTCFGFDWLGRVFSVDSRRTEEGRSGVLMLEPGTGEALEVPANLITFHSSELIEFGEAALAISFYDKWRAAGGAAPAYDQCVGYKRPLFLGGADEVENLELSDLDVYWHITGQLIRKTKGLPEGTPVRITID